MAEARPRGPTPAGPGEARRRPPSLPPRPGAEGPPWVPGAAPDPRGGRSNRAASQSPCGRAGAGRLRSVCSAAGSRTPDPTSARCTELTRGPARQPARAGKLRAPAGRRSPVGDLGTPEFGRPWKQGVIYKRFVPGDLNSAPEKMLRTLAWPQGMKEELFKCGRGGRED